MRESFQPNEMHKKTGTSLTDEHLVQQLRLHVQILNQIWKEFAKTSSTKCFTNGYRI